jgi:Family of unknown function (DUF6463)
MHDKYPIMSLFTTANLLIGTGIIHCGFGLLVQELRAPLLRSIRDVAVAVPDTNEHYARECCFWFQFAGVMLILQGCYMRSMNEVKDPPKWFGWALSAMGLVGAMLMPASGFWLILAQGIRIVWILDKAKTQ